VNGFKEGEIIARRNQNKPKKIITETFVVLLRIVLRQSKFCILPLLLSAVALLEGGLSKHIHLCFHLLVNLN
jgi:hypothetical protein